MGDPRGFLRIPRVEDDERPVAERVRDWREVVVAPDAERVRAQASRCMDCGVPFCHQACPLGNLVPEWNDLVHRGRLDEASRRLLATNNFPEITGRVCPAPCEAACVLNIRDEPVTIKVIERALADHAFASDGLRPAPATARTGARVAIVGSGPAGLACAQQLARAGHDVVVFERDDRLGGLLRYGIPDFKLEKNVLDERLDQMRAEGVVFRPGITAGLDVPAEQLLHQFDAVILAAGARVPRDLPIAGRELRGIHFAMEYLVQQNRRVAGDRVDASHAIDARGKTVVVVGGGDTGSDCVGTAIRQGARTVAQLELMPKPSVVRLPSNPWPEWPLVLRTSTSHDEGADREWALSTRSFVGAGGRVVGIETVRAEVVGGRPRPVEGTGMSIPCDLVLLAMGFVGPERGGVVEQLGLALDARGCIRTDASGATSVARVFATGDAARGQSLVVWAIADGRRVASGVDAHLRRARLRASA